MKSTTFITIPDNLPHIHCKDTTGGMHFIVNE